MLIDDDFLSRSALPLQIPRSPESLADRLGRLAVRQYALCALLVLMVAAFNVFVGLGTSRIDDSDEARYGVSAYEMTQNGSLLVNTYAGQPEYWNLKPPLGYWPVALSFYLFGVSPFTLRLPSALFALGTVALVMLFCGRFLNRRAALLAGLILATTFGFLSHHGARSGDLDSPLTFLLVLAAAQIPLLAGSRGRVIAFSAVLAAAFLLKSFAILPIVLVAVLHLAWTGAWRRLRWGACLAGAALFAAVVGAWGWARWHADGSAYFLQRMVGEDLLARSLREIDKGHSDTMSYLASLCDRFAPWPLLLIGAALLAVRTRGWRRLGESWGRKGRRVAPLLTFWIGVPLVLFSIARTHHHWYMDPVYPALAAVTAWVLLALLRRTAPARRTAAFGLLFVLPLTLCEARALHRVLVRDRLPEAQRFLMSLKERRNELGAELHAAGRLRHSERFILEAMDGYQVVEGPGDGPPFGARPEMPLLVRKAASRPQLAPAPGAEVLAEARGFALYGKPQLPDVEAARLRPSEDWKLFRFRRFRQPGPWRGRGVRS
jgi:4-amino-4-deoxy-L-arabinose transferase-like glycosyltransferase